MYSAEFYGELRCCRTKSEQHRLHALKTNAAAAVADLPRGCFIDQSVARLVQAYWNPCNTYRCMQRCGAKRGDDRGYR